mmetsp:Transcript_58694/g.96393  ORF Transcript_58694/g.96393 Transcript_58694/m.96393 type:complete len:89 (+) Transcript_58694:617-883(+)
MMACPISSVQHICDVYIGWDKRVKLQQFDFLGTARNVDRPWLLSGNILLTHAGFGHDTKPQWRKLSWVYNPVVKHLHFGVTELWGIVM